MRPILAVSLNLTSVQISKSLFTDNVPTLVVHASIVRKLDEIFCPTIVSRMSPELVEEMAAEHGKSIEKRMKLDDRLSCLENGARICGKYRVWSTNL